MGVTLPLDHPTPSRPHRVYVATTNACNRACPWCSTCSSPERNTYLTLEQLRASWPREGPFELQLEGGEPTIHPDFWAFVAAARAEPRCVRLVIATNGVRIPRDARRLGPWVERLGSPLVLKLSINHHLLDEDDGLLDLACQLRDRFANRREDQLVLNVRLRRCPPDDDAWVETLVREAGLLPVSNVFYLQRYGFAEDQETWERPTLMGHNFRLVNPDGTVLGPDLVARSEAMRQLP